MLITTTEFLNCGLPISEEIENGKLEYAIDTAEHFIVQKRLTDTMYLEITNNPTDYREVISGGVVEKDDKQMYLNGLKKAMYELAFAQLLMENVAATIFGSVIKKDDYSDQYGKDDIYMLAKRHTEIGLAYLKEIQIYLGIKNETKDLNNWTEEFI